MGFFFENTPRSKKHRELLKILERQEIELARRYNMLLGGAYNVPRYSNSTMQCTADFGFGFAVYYLLAMLESLEEDPSLSGTDLGAEQDEVIRQFVKTHRSYCSIESIKEIQRTETATSWMEKLNVPEVFSPYFVNAIGTIFMHT